MLPISLKVLEQPVTVVGRGSAAKQRYDLLHTAGAERIVLYVTEHDGWACHAEALLYQRLPYPEELKASRVVFVAGLGLQEATTLAEAARQFGVLVNVEDVPALCDFYVPAITRDGDLVVAVSTNGKVPGVAQYLKERIKTFLGEGWGAKVQKLSDLRDDLRRSGASKDEISTRLRSHLEESAVYPQRLSP